jgi:tetratricopeptide (TPR) repeat protein
MRLARLSVEASTPRRRYAGGREGTSEPRCRHSRFRLARLRAGWFGGAPCALGVALLLGGCAPRPQAGAEAAEARVRRAAASLAIFDFPRALEEFDRALERAEPGSDWWEQARYGRAVALWHRTPGTSDAVAEAERVFQQLAREAEAPSLRLRSLRNLGRMAELHDFPGDAIDLSTARRYYEEVIRIAPDSSEADEVAVRLAGTYFHEFEDRERVAAGVRLLMEWVERRPQNPSAGAMWLLIGDLEREVLNRTPAALAAYQKADAAGLPDRTGAAAVYWRIAQVAESVQRADVAREYYRRIILEFPVTGRTWEARRALARLEKVEGGA